MNLGQKNKFGLDQCVAGCDPNLTQAYPYSEYLLKGILNIEPLTAYIMVNNSPPEWNFQASKSLSKIAAIITNCINPKKQV